MLDKLNHVAQQAATNVSRRQFLGRFGRGAAFTAAALGGLLAMPTVAGAAKRVQMCSELSGTCSGQYVGSACGGSGTCQPVKHQKGRGKLSTVDCYCHRGSFGH